MDERMNDKNADLGIDLQRAFSAIMQKMWLILLVAVVFMSLTLVGTLFLITPQYESSAMFYVNNNSFSVGEASFSIDSSDISASKSLVNSYIVILNTRESLNEVIDYAGVNRSYKEMTEMITASAVNATEIFEVVVTSPDPQEAEKIANAIAYILPKRISSIIEGTSAKVVDSAVLPVKPSSPSYTVNAVVGFLIGMIVSVGVIVLREIYDITIRVQEDIEQSCTHPVLATVPNIALSGKGTSYGYGQKNRKTVPAERGKSQLVGEDISFAASEAYKLLRTKLQFSFTDENACRVIGISSALSGEGKSLTSVNLAYSLAQLDKKVLLIDCDMRKPTLAEKLGIQKKPGLSSFLTGQVGAEGLIQHCAFKNDNKELYVIAAGECPPNPIELLSSRRMTKVLESLRKVYDYVILDLPPVSEVSDALAVAKKTDGILLVVRQDRCNRIALNDTARQFGFIDAKILGVVFNCAGGENGSYGKYYYSRDYSKQRKSANAAKSERYGR